MFIQSCRLPQGKWGGCTRNGSLSYCNTDPVHDLNSFFPFPSERSPGVTVYITSGRRGTDTHCMASVYDSECSVMKPSSDGFLSNGQLSCLNCVLNVTVTFLLRLSSDLQDFFTSQSWEEVTKYQVLHPETQRTQEQMH